MQKGRPPPAVDTSPETSSSFGVLRSQESASAEERGLAAPIIEEERDHEGIDSHAQEGWTVSLARMQQRGLARRVGQLVRYKASTARKGRIDPRAAQPSKSFFGADP